MGVDREDQLGSMVRHLASVRNRIRPRSPTGRGDVTREEYWMRAAALLAKIDDPQTRRKVAEELGLPPDTEAQAVKGETKNTP